MLTKDPQSLDFLQARFTKTFNHIMMIASSDFYWLLIMRKGAHLKTSSVVTSSFISLELMRNYDSKCIFSHDLCNILPARKAQGNFVHGAMQKKSHAWSRLYWPFLSNLVHHQNLVPSKSSNTRIWLHQNLITSKSGTKVHLAWLSSP